MSESRYPYVHTHEEILNSKNINLIENGITYGKVDGDDPINTLFQDNKRRVIINGGVKELEEAADLNSFRALLMKQFSEKNIRNLEKFYSQTPMYFTGGYLYNGAITGDPLKEPFVFHAPSRECHLYQDKDGEVYFNIEAEDYPIADPDKPNIAISHIKGRVDAVFKLTDEGFKLQQVSTDSKLLSDMYLGNKISEAEIIESTYSNKLVLDALDKSIRDLIMNENRLRSIPKDKMNSNLELELAAARGVLHVIKDYKNDRIDFDDLQKAVAGYQIQANYANSKMQQLIRFFSRSSAKPTHQVLNNISSQLKEMNKNGNIPTFKL